MICIRRCERADLGALEWDGPAVRPLIAATFARAERGACEMLVAEEDAIVGQVWIDLDRDPDCGGLWALHVEPAYRRRGIATALLETAEQLVAACALRWALVEVEPDNLAARALYDRQGYKVVRVDGSGRLVLCKRIAHLRGRAESHV